MNQSFEVNVLISCKAVQRKSIYIENDLGVKLRAVSARLKERATIWAHQKHRVVTIIMAHKCLYKVQSHKPGIFTRSNYSPARSSLDPSRSAL
jgi:hypothetical protein